MAAVGTVAATMAAAIMVAVIRAIRLRIKQLVVERNSMAPRVLRGVLVETELFISSPNHVAGMIRAQK